MNLQDRFQYSSTIVGLNDQYIDKIDSAYINHSSIDIPGKIVHKDAHYTLIEVIGDRTVSYTVNVVEIFHYHKSTYILFVDTRNGKVGLKSMQYEQSEEIQSWKLTGVI